MNRALKSTNSIESNVYSLRSDWKALTSYIVIDSSGDGIDHEYNSYRSMLNDFMDTDIGTVLDAEYRSSLNDSFDHQSKSFDEDEFQDFCSENFKRVASELGYRILTVIK